jgi:hypothetical protein
MSSETEIRPFRGDMPDEALDDLRRRIGAARWPGRELVDDRSQGVQLATIQELARYCRTGYDWRRCEARLNALPQFTTEIDGVDVHFIHVKSPHQNALPLIITHGWPGSVIELLGVIGPTHRRMSYQQGQVHKTAQPYARRVMTKPASATWTVRRIGAILGCG